MNKEIEKILIELTFRTAERFNLDYDKAIEAVALSRSVNNMIETENKDNRTVEELSATLFDEISFAR